MREIIDIMLKYFSDSKLAGSYFLLFLVSIVLLYYMNRQKNRWFIMYGILLLVVVVMNPVSVWLMVQVFPSLISYGPITMLVPILIYIPFAAAELNESLKEIRIRRIVTIILVFLIFICGNMCGVVKDYSVFDSNVTDAEELDVIRCLNEAKPNMVLADEAVIPAISARGNAIPLFYGRDLWTANMDTGIMDGYNEEAYALFDAMKNSKENADFIADTAYEYRCDIIVMDNFEEAPSLLGRYKLINTTQNYLIYRLDGDM
ncbi:MAG: hypothetical protein J6W58_03140 [Lachnospiraceae bacterium]|nr:hypothetical protein [Lachnospiraceae bacterium]